MNMDKKLCYCKNVTIGQVAEAIQNGAKSLEEVQETTNLGKGCKRCLENASRVVDELINE